MKMSLSRSGKDAHFWMVFELEMDSNGMLVKVGSIVMAPVFVLCFAFGFFSDAFGFPAYVGSTNSISTYSRARVLGVRIRTVHTFLFST